MFKWFKVLKKLSHQNDVIEETERKISVLSATVTELEKKFIELQNRNAELERNILENLKKNKCFAESLKKENEQQEKKNEACRADMNRMLKSIDESFDTFGQRAEKAGADAKAHLTEIDDMVLNYEAHVKELGTKLTELGNVIAEFQR